MDFNYKLNDVKLGFSTDILKNILKARGITDVNKFLNLNDSVLEDYNNFDNVNLAGEILIEHIEKDNKIGIVVDFDSDGYTSGAEMYLYLKDIYSTMNKQFNVEYIIHSTKSHGLDNEIMQKIYKGQYNLVIIPDAGSNDYSQHNELFNKNIEVICLDHHQCRTYSPHACVVNNQMSSKIKNKAMTGVGVVYKFCKWLDNRLNVNYADKYLDLVALGMIADSCDLRDLESRYLVLKGLQQIEDGINNNKFISKIYKEKSYSMENKVTINGVAFYMSPTVNCIIRGGDYETKVNLFKAFIGSDEIFTDKVRGKGIVEMTADDYMLRVYKKIKKEQDITVSECVEMLKKQIEEYKLDSSEIMVINGKDIEDSTYNRIIVNKLSSLYQKHALLLKPVDNNLMGSCAGFRNKDITDLRKWCQDTKLFNYAEGHPLAFGSSIPIKNINKLYDIIGKIPSNNNLTYTVDGVFNEKSLNKSMVNLIGSLSYAWGNKLDEPLFAIENILIPSKDIVLMGKAKTTLKFKYNDIEFIKFKITEDEYNNIIKNENNKFTIIGRFKTNNYNNSCIPQVLIENYKFEKTTEVKKFVF